MIGVGRELVGCRKDGTVFPMDLAVSEISHGRGFTGIVRDLTERKGLERRLVAAQSEERQRLAHDLHDDLGGELTGLGLLAASVQQQLEKDGWPHLARLEAIVERVHAAHARLREIAQGLQPVETIPEGLLDALRTLAERCTAAPEASCRCRVVSDPPVLVDDAALASSLFHIAQEAVNNAVRHAAPCEVTIEVARDAGGVRLDVIDDGSGFDPAQPTGAGLGLSNMRQRARQLGGELVVRPRAEGGTVVTCVIPDRAGPEDRRRRSGARARRSDR